MKNLSLLGLLAMLIFLNVKHSTGSSVPTDNTEILYTAVSVNLLDAVINEEPTKEILELLAKADINVLAKQLNTDQKRKAFWINVYNAHIQIFLQKNPELYEDRGKFFGAKRMLIAGNELSFDDVEHGIIRGSRNKLTLGYTKKLFVPKFERKFRCDKRDGRIHFALNCGAKSCPKVAIFYADRIDEQLDAISKQFLTAVTEIEGNTVRTTTLFSWFRGDFGGKNGVEKFLKKMGLIPQDMDPDIQFKTYDWTLYLGNYTSI